MVEMMRNKKGLTSGALVKIVVLVVSFSILVWAFSAYLYPMLKGGISDATCQQTIEMRAGVSGIGAQSAVPIKCQTKKICFVKDKEEGCVEFKGLDYEKVIIKENYKENLIKEITLLQYDAWKVLGEGRLDYAPSEFWTLKTEKSYCAPYARLAFSQELKKEFEKEIIFSYEFIEYQQKNLVPDRKISYFRFLYGADSLSDVSNQIKNEKGIDVAELKFDINKQYYIMSIAVKETWFKTIAGGVAGGVVSAVLLSTGVGILVVGVAGGGTIGYLTSSGETSFMPPTLIEYDAEVLSGLKCDDFDFSP